MRRGAIKIMEYLASLLGATLMRVLRDPCIRGLLLPRICDQGTQNLVHTTQCVLARAWAKILEVVAQVGVKYLGG